MDTVQQENKLILYVLDDCIGCKIAASNLNKLNVNYDIKNIKHHIDAIKKINVTDVPSLVVNKNGKYEVLCIGSFSVNKIRHILEIAHII